MRTGGKGYDWTPPLGMMPALCGAAELVHMRVQPTGKLLQDCWVLDYNLTAGERVRFGSPSAPWHDRPAGVAYLYPPQLPYWEAPKQDGKPQIVHCLYLLFADTGTLQLDRLLPAETRFARFLDEAGLLGDVMTQLIDIAAAEQANGYWRAYARFCEIITLLQRARRYREGTYGIVTEQAQERSSFVHTAQRYFLEHLTERITLADLAQHLGMSVSAFSHRYRAEMGESPMTTLKRERIHLAKSLLAKGYHLKAIARQVGFFDEFHLSKTFKQVEGVTPRAYQQTTTLPSTHP